LVAAILQQNSDLRKSLTNHMTPENRLDPYYSFNNLWHTIRSQRTHLHQLQSRGLTELDGFAKGALLSISIKEPSGVDSTFGLDFIVTAAAFLNHCTLLTHLLYLNKI